MREKENRAALSKMVDFINQTDLCNPNTKVIEIIDKWIDDKNHILYIIYESNDLELRFGREGGKKEEKEKRKEGGGGRVGEGGREEEMMNEKCNAMEAIDIILSLTRTLKNLDDSNDLKKLDLDFVGGVSSVSIFESKNEKGFFFDLYNFEIVSKREKQPFLSSYLSLIKQLNAPLNNPLLNLLKKGLKETPDWKLVFGFPLFSFEKNAISKQWSTYYQQNKKSLQSKGNKGGRRKEEKNEEERRKSKEEERKREEEEKKREEERRRRKEKDNIESTVKKDFLEVGIREVGGRREDEGRKKQEGEKKEGRKGSKARTDGKEEERMKKQEFDDSNEDTTLILKKKSSYNGRDVKKDNLEINANLHNRSFREEEVGKKQKEVERQKEKRGGKTKEEEDEDRKKKRREEERDEGGKSRKEGRGREEEWEESKKMSKDEKKAEEEGRKRKEEVGKRKKEGYEEGEEVGRKRREEEGKRRKEGGGGIAEKDYEVEEERRKKELKSKKKGLESLIKKINSSIQNEDFFDQLGSYWKACNDLLKNYKSKELNKFGEEFKSRLITGLRVSTLMLTEGRKGKRDELQFMLRGFINIKS